MTIDTSVETAAAFVVQRLEEEAYRDDAPLNDEQRFLLNHLPTEPNSSSWGSDPEFPPVLTPRDFNYEKLCRLTKAAICRDLQTNPEAITHWHLAAAVFKLNEHPMAWLLEWGGVKPERPWWDKWLLVFAGLLFVACGMAAMFIADSHRSRTTWIIAACGYVVVLMLIYVVLKRLERWQLNRTVEKLRHASHLG